MRPTVQYPLIPRPTRRQFLKYSLAGLSGLALSSCGWTLANVRPTPSQGSSDVLYIYTWAGYTDDDLFDRFEKETGIRAIANVFDSNEAMLARIQAGGGSAYSIIYPSDYMVQQMVSLDLLNPLDHSRITGLDRLFPRFQDPQYDSGNQYSIPVSWGTTGLIYNRKKLREEPTDWDYLWQYRDVLSKRMTLLNDVREVIGATLKMLGYSYNSRNPKEIEAAYEKLTQLKPAIASFTSDAWRTQVLTGDLLLAMVYSSDANEVMQETDDLEYVLPSSGSSLWTDTLVIPRSAPNVEGAYAWINFMLQPDVAAQICERLSFATPNKQAYQLLPPDIQNNRSLFPPESAIERCEGLAPVGAEMSEVYDLYWTRLTSA
ncbi:MAG: ABC transporter substrate-binding protein [Chroococcales cyanobacterium]